MTGLRRVLVALPAEGPRIGLIGQLAKVLNDHAPAKFELRLACGIQCHCHDAGPPDRHSSFGDSFGDRAGAGASPRVSTIRDSGKVALRVPGD